MPDDKLVLPARKSAIPLLVGFLAAAVLAAAAYFWALPRMQGGAASTAVNPVAGIAAASLAALVDEETAKWPIRPHNFVSTTDKAMSAADALRRGDFIAAQALSEEVLAHSKLQAFSFHPFNRFIGHLSLGNDPKLLTGLDAWVQARPKAALPRLLRAKYYYDSAWAVRGSNFSSAVPPEHMRRFDELLERAEADVNQSIEIDPAIPWSYYLQLLISVVRDTPEQIDQVFQAAIARYPGYYELYDTRLDFLAPKWGGSAAAMYQFVDRYAGRAAHSSQLKLLYMQLTANLLNSAWVECRPLQHEELTRCVNAYMNRYVTGGLTQGVTKALNLYKLSDPVQFSDALRPILKDMVRSGGDAASIDTVLQLASEAMGSDNQLIHEPGHNNYVLDDVTALTWSKLGDTTNVEQKFREALDDVERIAFESDDDRSAALGDIYDDMAWTARNNSQYVKVIAFHNAANTVAGVNRGETQYNKCNAYYKLQHMREAVDECTLLINTHRGEIHAYTYRAWANEALHNYDAALADYTLIADDGSDHVLRAGAAINMGHIDALRGQIDAELEVFNKYPFIFDARVQDDDDLAIAYNNRCFDYKMKGELRKALEDCTTSLKYGRLPDALQKYQQLVKALKEKST